MLVRVLRAGAAVALVAVAAPPAFAQNACTNACWDQYTSCRSNADEGICEGNRSYCELQCRGGGSQPSAPLAPTVRWGFLVFDLATSRAGYAWDFSNGADARGRATRECFKAGGKACEWRIPARGGCVAVAQGDGGAGRMAHQKSGGKEARAYAQNKAVQNCRKEGASNCKVVASVCSFGQ
jgi:hypothetical protein